MTEVKAPKVNYTEAMVTQIIDMYAELGNAGMEEIAKAVGRPVKSVRAKLVRENVYVAPEAKAKVAKDEGPTKKEMLIELAALVDFDVAGLMGATKPALQSLIDMAKEAAADDSEDDLADDTAESE